MIAADSAAFLEAGGCSLIVGTVAADGEPHASRAFGLTVLTGEPPFVRILVDADHDVVLGDLTEGAPIAVTGACVRTLRSMQVKGRVVSVEPATEADQDHADWFADALSSTIEERDGTPRELVLRLEPARYVACTIAVDELFDQTPGPGAGAPIAAPPA